MQSQRERVRRRIGGAALLVSALTTSSASAGLAIVENDTEINDSFLTRQVLSPGATGVSGNLDPAVPFDPADFDYVFKSSLSPGVARSFVPAITGLEGRIGYFAWTDNTVGDGPSPDTIMRSLDQNLNQNMFGDNTTLVGNGFASLFAHHTNPDGTINLEVSGVGDHTFTGNHTETGDFNLYIKVRPVGDLDVYSFVDLVPGSAFDAEITTAEFDTVLGWLNDDGNIVTIDNNGGTGTLSRIQGIVPASGIVTLVVTGSNDNQLFGLHPDSGNYNLDFRGAYIPSPAAAATLGLLAFGARRRR